MIPPVVIGGAPPVTANPALVRFSAARWPTLPSPRTAIVVNPIDLPVRWPRKLRFAPRRIRRRLNLFNRLGAESCNSVSSEMRWRATGTGSTEGPQPHASDSRASTSGAPFPGAESVISRLSDSISRRTLSSSWRLRAVGLAARRRSFRRSFRCEPIAHPRDPLQPSQANPGSLTMLLAGGNCFLAHSRSSIEAKEI